MATTTKQYQEGLAAQKGKERIDQLNQPKEFDVFKAMTGGFTPSTMTDVLSNQDKLVLHDRSYYADQLKIDPNDPEYNKVYDQVVQNYQDINKVIPFLPTDRVRPYVPYGELESYHRPDLFARDVANNYITYGGFEGNEFYPTPTNRNRAAGRNFIIATDEKGNDFKIDRPLRGKDRRDPYWDYEVEYDMDGKWGEKGEAYYHRVPANQDYSGKEKSSFWGEIKRYGWNPLDFPLGFVSGATTETLGALARVGQSWSILGQYPLEKIGIKPSGILENFFGTAANQFNELKYEPSEETQELGFTSGWKEGIGKGLQGLYYATGQGLGMLLIQMLPGLGMGSKLGQLVKLSPKTAMRFSAGIGTLQANADIYESAKEAGLDKYQAATFAALALPAVYTTERLIAAPYLTRRFQRNEINALKGEITDGLEGIRQEGKDITDEGVQRVVLKKALGKYYDKIGKGIGKGFTKLKSGQMGWDQIPVVPGLLREGSQETLEEIYYIAQEMGWDATFGKGQEKGEGAFGVGTEEWNQQVGKRLKESAVGGALLGGIASGISGHAKKEHGSRLQKSILIELGVDKGYQELSGQFQSMYRGNGFGSDGFLFNGTPLTIEERQRIDQTITQLNDPNTTSEDQKKLKDSLPFTITVQEDNIPNLSKGQTIYTERDINYYNAFNGLNRDVEIIKTSGIDNIDLLEQIDKVGMENDPVFTENVTNYQKAQMFQAIDIAKKLRDTQTDIANLTASIKPETTEDQRKKIQVDIDKKTKLTQYLQQELNDRLVPEEGSAFPKKVNQFAKTHLAAMAYAKERTDAQMKGEVLTKEEKKNKYVHFLDRVEGEEELPTIEDIEEVGQPIEPTEQITPPKEKESKAKKVIGKIFPEVDKTLNDKVQQKQKRLNLFVANYNDYINRKYQPSLGMVANDLLQDEIDILREEAIGKKTEQVKTIPQFESLLTSINKIGETIPEGGAVSMQKDLTSAIDQLTKLSLPKTYTPEGSPSPIETIDQLKQSIVKASKKIQQQAQIEFPTLTEPTEEEFGDDYLKALNEYQAHPLIQSGFGKQQGKDRVETRTEQLADQLIKDSELNGIPIENLLPSADPELLLKQDRELMKDDRIQRLAYLRSVERKVKVLQNSEKNNWEDLKDSSMIGLQIGQLISEINLRKEIAKVNNEVVEHQMKNHPTLSRYLTPQDHPLTDTVYKGKDGIESRLQELHREVLRLQDSFGKASNSQPNKLLNIHMREIELRRQIWNYLNRILKLDDLLPGQDIKGLIDQIAPLTQEEKNATFLDTEDTQQRMLNAEVALYNLSKVLYDNKDQIIYGEGSTEALNVFIEKVFRPLYRNNTDGYLNGQDYGLTSYNYIDLIDKIKQDGSNVKDSPLFSVQLANYLETTLSIDPEKLLAANQEIVKKMGELPKTEPLPTSEQWSPINQLAAFLDNKGTVFIDALVKEQSKWSLDIEVGGRKPGKTEISNRQKSLDKINEIYRKTNQFIPGDLATGKTTVIIRNALNMLSLLNPNRTYRVGVYAHTSQLMKTLLDATRGIDNVEIIQLTKNKQLDHHADLDFLFWDEAGLLSRDKIVKLQDNNKELPIIYLGDQTQMVDLKRDYNTSDLVNLGARTKPMSYIHSTGLKVHQDLIWHFRKLMIFPDSSEPWPSLFEKKETTVSPEGIQRTSLKGGRYYTNGDDVLSAFLDRQTSEKAIVFPTFEIAKKAIDNDHRLYETPGTVYVLEDGDSQTFNEDQTPTSRSLLVESIQGLRVKEIYIPFDIKKIGSLNPNLTSLVARVGYTATSRVTANGYIALVGFGNNAKSEDEVLWFDPNVAAKESGTIKDTTRYKSLMRLYEVVNPGKIETAEIKKEVKSEKAEQVFKERDIVRIISGDNKGSLVRITQINTNKNGKKTGWAKGIKLMETGEPIFDEDTSEPVVISFRVNSLEKATTKEVSAEQKKQIVKAGIPIVPDKVFVFDDVDGQKVVMVDSVEDEIIGHLSTGEEYRKPVTELSPIGFTPVETIPEAEEFKDQHEQVTRVDQGRIRTRLDIMQESGDVLWGTTYTVFHPDHLVSKTDTDALRSIFPLIASTYGSYQVELEHHDNATYWDDNLGQQVTGEVFFVKISPEAVNKVKDALRIIQKEKEDKLSNQVLESIRRVLNNEFDQSLQYISALQIKDVNPGSERIISKLRELSKEKENLKVNLNIQQTLPGRLIKGEEKDAAEFVTYLESLGYDVDQDWVWKSSMENTSNGAFVKYFHMGTASGYIIGRTPKMQTLSQDDLKDQFDKDYAQIKDANSREELNSSINTTFLINLLRSNRSLFYTKDGNALTALGEKITDLGVRFVDGRFYFGPAESTTKGEIKAIKSLMDELVNNWDDSSTKTIRQMFRPAFLDTSAKGEKIVRSKNISGRTLESPNLLVKYSRINAPSIYVNVNPITNKTLAPSGKKTGLKESTDRFDNRKRRSLEKQRSDQTRRIKEEKVIQLVQQILGPNEAFEVFGENSLVDDYGKVLYGRMFNGRLQFEQTREGIQVTAPRHEIFHKVFNYALSSRARIRLVEDWRVKQNNPNLTFDEAEEQMARQYGEKGDEVPSWTTPTNLLQRFARWLDRVLIRFRLYNKDLTGLIADLENGVFRGTNFSLDRIVSRNLEMDGNEEQQLEELQLLDLEKSNQLLKERFGNHSREVVSWVGYRLNELSPFNNNNFNTDLKPLTFLETINEIRQDFKDEAEESSKNITLNQALKGDWYNYRTYQLSQDDVFAAVLGKLLPSFNIKNGKFQKHSNDTLSDLMMEDPRSLRSDILSFQIGITELMPWDSFQRSFISAPLDFIGNKEINLYLGNASVLAKRMVNEGKEKNYIDALINALQREANTITTDTRKKDMIMSFIQRWLKDLTFDRQGISNKRSFREEAERILSSSDPTEAEQEVVKLFNSLISTISNYGQLKPTDYKVYYGSDYKLHVKVDNRVTDSFAEEKRRIQDQVRNALLDRSTFEPSAFKLSQITKSDRQVFDIAPDGIYYIRNKQRIKFIDNKNGEYSLTQKDGRYTFDHDMIDEVRRYFGLGNIRYHVWTALRDGKNTELISFLKEFTGLNFAESNFSQQVLASGIHSMFSSMKLWGTLRQNVINLTENLDQVYDTQEEIDREIIRITNQETEKLQGTIAYKQLVAYMEKSKELQTLDPTLSYYEDQTDEEVFYDEEWPFATPVSFFNFFNTLAKVKTFYSNDPANSFVVAYDGTKRCTLTSNSSFSRKFENGSGWLPGAFESRIKPGGVIDEEVVKESIFAEKIGDELVIYNPLLDKNDPMTLLESRRATSLVYYKGTNDPNTADILLMTIHSFMNGIKKKNEVVVVPTMNLGSSHKLELLNGTIDNGFKMRLFNKRPVIRDGHFQSDLKVNWDWVNHKIDQLFNMNYRTYKVRSRKVYDFLRNDPLTQSLIKKLPSLSTNPVSYSEQLQYIFDQVRLRPDYDQFAERLEKSDLVKTLDYFIDEKGVRPGRALLMDDPLMNYANYQVWKETKDKNTVRAQIFNRELDRTIGDLIKHTDKIPDELRGMLSDNGQEAYYLNLENQNKIYNPILEGWFYSYYLFNSFTSPLVFGNWQSGKSTDEKSKAARTSITPKTHLIAGLGGLETSLRILNIKSDLLINPRNIKDAMEIKIADGEGIGNPVTMSSIYMNLGDQYSTFDRTATKPLVDYTDIVTGKRIKYKQALETITGDTYSKSPYYRSILKAMLDHTTYLVQQSTDYTGDLHKEFKGYLEGNSFDEAIRKLVNSIQRSPYRKEIMNNMVWQAAFDSTIKEGQSNINQFDPSFDESEVTQGSQMMSVSIPVNEIGFILNPFQDVNRYKENATRTNQLFSYLGTAVNKNRATEVDKILGNIYDLAHEEVRLEIQRIEIPEGIRGIDEHIYRMSEFLRGRGLKILDKIDMGGNFANIILNKNNSIDYPGVRELVIYSFRNYINDTMVNRKMDGVRLTQLDGSFFPVFRSEDNRMMWDEMERLVGKELSLMDLTPKKQTKEEIASRGKEYTFELDGVTYSVSRLQPMMPGKKGEVLIPFSMIEQFGLTPDQSLNEIFTIHFKDKPSVNVRNKTNKQVRKILAKAIKDDTLDNQKTLMRKQTDYWDDYLTAAHKVLDNLFNSRVPLNRIGSGDVNEVVGFVNDNGNVIYLPPEKVALDDSDFDIDAKTTYLYSIDKDFKVVNKGINGLNNQLLDQIVDIYTDPKEESSVFFSSNISHLKKIRDEYANKVNRSANTLNTFIEQTYMNEVGKESIAIYAVGASTLGYIAKLGPKIKSLAPGFMDILNNLDKTGKENPIIRVGDLLQVALDNEKNDFLAPLGITRDAAPIAISMVASGRSWEELAEFFANPIIENIFHEISKRHSILEKWNDYTPYQVVQERLDIESGVLSTNKKGRKEVEARLEEIIKNNIPEGGSIDEVDKFLSTDLLREYQKLSRLVKAMDRTTLLNELMDYLVQAEAIFRLGRSISLRNGIKVLESDHEFFNRQLTNNLGMSQEDWLDKKVVPISKQLDYWKENSIYKNYPVGSIEQAIKKDTMLAFENRVRKAIDLPEVIRSFPTITRYVSAQLSNNHYLNEVFLPHTKWSRIAEKTFQTTIEQNGWRFPKQLSEYRKELDRPFIDYFFKDYPESIVTLPTAFMEVDLDGLSTGKAIKNDSLLETLDLSKTANQLKFRVLFPSFFDFLREASENRNFTGDPVYSDKVLEQLDDGTQRFQMNDGEKLLRTAGYDPELASLLRENLFFNSLSLEGDEGGVYVQMNDGRRMEAEEIGAMQEAFEELPLPLQKLFQFNQLISRGLQYTKGTISDVVGTGLYPEISKSLENYKDYLRNTSEGIVGIKPDELMNYFVQSLGTNSILVPYLNEEAEVTSGRNPEFFYRYEKIRRWLKRIVTYQMKDNFSVPIWRKYPRLFSIGENNISVKEPIRNLTPEDVEWLERMKQLNQSDLNISILKTFPRGHGYKNDGIYRAIDSFVKARASLTSVRFFFNELTKAEMLKENAEIKGREMAYRRHTILRLAEEEQIRQQRIEEKEQASLLSKEESTYKLYQREEEEVDKETLEANFLPQQRLLTGNYSRAMNRFRKMEGRRLTQRSWSLVTDYLSNQYGVTFIPDTLKYTKTGESPIAWFESDGIHFDENRINLATPLHELNHVWLDILEKIDPEMYANLIKKIDGYRGGEIFKIIQDTYSDRGKEIIDKEFLATMTGFWSQDILNDWLMKKGVEQDARTIWDDIKYWVRSVINRIFPSLSRHLTDIDADSSLRSMLRAFSISALNGELSINGMATETLLAGVYQRELRRFTDKDVVSDDIREFVPFFLNGSEEFMTSMMVDRNRYTDYIIESHPTITGEELVYSAGGMVFRVPYSSDREVMKKRIREMIVDPLYERDATINAAIRDMIYTFETEDKEGKSLEHAVNAYDPLRKNENLVRDLLYYTGAYGEVDQVLRYSDLKNSTNPTLKNLYKESFVGFDPLLVIHNINPETGKVSMSLIDATVLPVMNQTQAVKGDTLTAAFQSPAEFKRLGGRMTNDSGNIRKMMLGMQMMAMSKGNDISFRNIGVLGVSSSVKPFMVADYNEIINDLRILGRNKTLTDIISNPDIKEVLTSETLLNKEYHEEAIERLKLYYKDTMFRGKLKDSPSDIFGKNVTDTELREMIIWRMRQLKKNPLYEHNYEFQMLSEAKYQLESKETGWFNHLDQISKVGKWAVTAHNVESPVFQYFREQYLKAVNKVNELVKNYQKEMNPVTDEIIKFYHRRKGYSLVERYARDIGSNYFERLWKTTQGYDKNGNLITKKNGEVEKFLLPEIHWSLQDPETKRLYDEGKLSDIELKYANQFLDKLEKRWIDNLYHIEQIDGGDRSYKDISDDFYSQYKRGYVPAIGKTGGALFSQLNLKGALPAIQEKLARSENIFEGDFMDREGLDKLSTHFHNQWRVDARMKAAGLVRMGERYILEDQNKNKSLTLNLQDIGNYFQMEGIRKEVFEKELLPDYNAARTIFTLNDSMYRGDPFSEKDNTTRDYLDAFVNRSVFNQNMDYGIGKEQNKSAIPKLTIAGHDIYLNEVTRGLILTGTFLSLAFRPVIWLKSFIYNELQLAIHSLATTIANKVAEYTGAEEMNIFEFDDLLYAHSQMVLPADFQKAWLLAKKFQLVEGSERDLLTSPIINKTNQNIFQARIAHIGNWATDSYARTLAMVAQMHREGSYKAYSIKDGEISYDITKDDRFYKDGVIKSDADAAIIKEIRQNLINQGVMREGDQMALGHDALLADNFRWLANKFVVGSYDNTSKVFLSNHYAGMLLSNFRMFSFDRFNNAGIFVEGWKSKSGSQYKAVLDGDVWITKRNAMDIEGVWKSNINGLMDLTQLLKGKSFAEINRSMTPMRRMNMVKSVINLAMFMLIKFLITGFMDKDDERRFASLYKDLMSGYTLSEMMKSPFAASNTVTKMWNLVFSDSDRNVNQLMKLFPGPTEFILFVPSSIKALSADEREQARKKRLEAKEKKKEEKKEPFKLIAANGLVSKGEGGEWSLVEDLQGLPSHAEGGVDIKVENGRVGFTESNSFIHAKDGLFIAQQGGVTRKTIFDTYPFHLTNVSFDVPGFVKGIRGIESLNGILMKNSVSTARGLYGQRYSEITDYQKKKYNLNSIDDFTVNERAQHEIMFNRILGDRKESGRSTNYVRDVKDLKNEFNGSFKGGFPLRDDEIAAVSHFLGRSGAREYLQSLAEGKPFAVKGINKTPEEYLVEYNRHKGETQPIKLWEFNPLNSKVQ